NASSKPSCCAATRRTSFSFTAPATTEIYTLSLHDALPIYPVAGLGSTAIRCALWFQSFHDHRELLGVPRANLIREQRTWTKIRRSEEHTSELQSRGHLVCRLLLEKKKEPCRGVQEAAHPRL